jgi:hypothetical protein
VHVVGHSLASLMLLVSLDEATLKWIVFLKLVVSSGLVVAKHGGNSQVLRSGIEDNSCWLGGWRAHVHSSEVDGVVLAVKRNLELKIISIILRQIGNFTNQLSCVDVSAVGVGSLIFALYHIIIFDELCSNLFLLG